MSTTSVRKRTYVRGTVEYVEVNLTERFGTDITVNTPAIALEPADAVDVENATWLPATWDTDGDGDSYVRTTSVVDFAVASYASNRYRVFADLTGAPEVPIVDCGVIEITG